MSNAGLTPIDALLAREAIRDLPVRYCDCVWRDDMAGLTNLFHPDGSFIVIRDGRETTISGHEDLRKFFDQATDFMPRPFIHNHVVELNDADSATGRCYLDLRSAKNNMDWLGTGYYEDDYARTDSGWVFKSRRFHVIRMDELPPGLD